MFAHHGVFEHERRDGQQFVIDVTLRAAATPNPGDNDDLAGAVDYGAVCDRVVELVSGGPYNLIEKVADVVCAALLAEFPVDRGNRAGGQARRARSSIRSITSP